MSPPLGICSLERDSSPATHGETRIQGDVVNPRDNIGDKAVVVRSSLAESEEVVGISKLARARQYSTPECRCRPNRPASFNTA
ncbi:hypothetical protein P3T25_004154 [Paraburkholderia sp. GAS32]